jgi:methionine-R-sulfoxide reductase
VTQKDGTEIPFRNELWDEKRDRIYIDILSGEPLFSSEDKYRSGTGWPSFTKPLEAANLETKEGNLLGYQRIEARSRYGDNHLGHIFNDGPTTLEASGGAPATGLRWCLNSAALKFISKSDLEADGYGQYLGHFETAE